MKAIWILTLAAALPFAGHCNDTDLSIGDQTIQIVEFADITPEVLDTIRAGEVKNAAIFFPANTQLPFDLQIKGNVLQIEGDSGNRIITFPYDLYVNTDGEELFFSRDGLSWKELDDFVTGDMQACLNIDENGPYFQMHLELNQQ